MSPPAGAEALQGQGLDARLQGERLEGFGQTLAFADGHAPAAAALVGVSPRTWQNWESGERFPRSKHRRALDDFLETKVEATA